MGQQLSNNHSFLQRKNEHLDTLNKKLQCKTTFHYIKPLSCQNQQQTISMEPMEEIDLKTHEAQYWEIQNNIHDQPFNSLKDLEKIEQIKVKWNTFIKMKKRNYLEDYSVLKQIGRGGFGCVHKVKARYTGLYRAAKRIKKSQLKKQQHEKLFEQMAIMMSLDHPNIAKLYEVYDYKSYYVLILELCEGGELFKKIVTKQINEAFAAKITKQICRTLIYLHKQGIVHRDLKPQNMLFQTDSDMLKLIDFGIAVKKKPQEILTARLGTPYYIAPEVLCKKYDQKCDIWSAGVILFMMISGYPPFKGDNQLQVMENVLKQPLNFKGTVWGRTSNQCKSLVSWMLTKNPDQRPSAEQVFEHPWLKKVVEHVSQSRQQNVLANLRSFSFQNKLQAVVYTYIVSQLLTSSEKRLLFQIFKDLDKNSDGLIGADELYAALKGNKQISQQRVKFLMRVIDTNASGHIDYTQFLVAGIDAKICLTQEHFQQAFQYFDIDHSGAITFEQIAHFLEDTKQSEESIKKIFQQVDQNGDGSISKEQFVKLLMKETKKKLSSMTLIGQNQHRQRIERSSEIMKQKIQISGPRMQKNSKLAPNQEGNGKQNQQKPSRQRKSVVSIPTKIAVIPQQKKKEKKVKIKV